MKKKSWMSLTAVGLLVALAVLISSPAGVAAPVPSQMTTSIEQTSPAPETVSSERALVKATLMDFGLKSDQAQSRVDLLTDQEVHALAADLDSIKAGAAHTYTNVEILLLLILVVLIVD